MNQLLKISSALLLLALAGCLWGPLLKRSPLHDELVYAHTADGWDIAMHHYRAAEGVVKRPYPLIVCHGISTNERSWSMSPDRSFPRYMAARGWDVWAIDLRGVGESTMPGVIFGDKSYDFAFDAFVTQDVPAVIDAVLAKTGAERVNWVGHSMGGMVIYGYVSTYGDAKLKSVIAVESPVAFHGVNRHFEFAKPYAVSMRDYIPPVRDTFMVQTIAPFVGSFNTRMEYFIWNYDNLDRETEQALAYNMIGNMSAGVLRQLAGVFAGGDFSSVDGSIDYLRGLSRMRAPLFVVAGMSDNLVPPQNALPAYEHSGSVNKRFHVLARANGYTSDYGHVDTPIGDNSATDVYPVLESWLNGVQ